MNSLAKRGVNMALAMRGRDRFAYIPRPIPVIDVHGPVITTRASEDILREAIACGCMEPNPKPHARKWAKSPEANALYEQYRSALRREIREKNRRKNGH